MKSFKVKNGSVSVHVRWDAERAGWIVDARIRGERIRRRFTDKREAQDEAFRLAAQIANGEGNAAELTGEDAAMLRDCRGALADAGIELPLDDCIRRFVAAVKWCGLDHLTPAAQAYAQAGAPPPAVKLIDAAERNLKTLANGERSPRHVADVRARLGRFCHEHPEAMLGDITPLMVQEWVGGLTKREGGLMSGQSKRNFYKVLSAFFKWCVKQGLLRTDPTDTMDSPRVQVGEDIDFWDADEAGKLLNACSESLLPTLLTGLFCGVRSAELCRLTRANVDLEGEGVTVKAGIAKTASRRLVPLCEAFKAAMPDAWTMAQPETRVFKGEPKLLARKITELCRGVGVRRVNNGMRHTFITMSVALTGDVGRVALVAGNTPEMIHKHYKGLVSKNEAERFFALRRNSIAGLTHGN